MTVHEGTALEGRKGQVDATATPRKNDAKAHAKGYAKTMRKATRKAMQNRCERPRKKPKHTARISDA